MTKQWIDAAGPPPSECPECGSASLHRRVEMQRFRYGPGDDGPELQAEVPVWRCAACNFAFTDDEGEAARHSAVCRFLKRLTPAAIRDLRQKIGMTRQQFCKFTGVGEASLKRWESGELIQNEAMDYLIRLAGDPVATMRLRDIHREAELLTSAEIEPTFRTPLSGEIKARARVFELRPVRKVA